jgi:hypothetical protein
VRRVDAAVEFELFFVVAVATILIVRAALALTGWPQLGGGKIHFAHLMWGGLGMLIGFIIFMGFTGRLWRQLAAVAAGIGFGLFIDELGKFITSDNDYFFRPTIAIIYVLFVALFFVFEWIGHIHNLSPQAALVNALDYAKEAVLRDMDQDEQDQAVQLLQQADQDSPVVAALKEMIRGMEAREATLNPVMRAKHWLDHVYSWLVAKAWFKRVIVGWFVLVALIDLLFPILELYAALTDADPGRISLAAKGALVSGAVAGVLVVVGIVRWRESALAAYRWFERAVLVSILVGEVFRFYETQLNAVFGLVLLLGTLGVIRSMIAAEEARLRSVTG